MTENPFVPPVALRSLIVAGVLAFTLAGCSASAPESSGSENNAPESSEKEGNEEVTVIGEELPGTTALRLATTYAEGRDIVPTVEFVDATTVRFSFADGADALNECQIAWSVMNGEGIYVYIDVAGTELDCSAEF